MNKEEYVLFTCVGDTDPYRDDYDGPMTHIVRMYKPKKVYIYFSYEKRNNENLANRFTRAIHYLDNNIEIEEFPKMEEDLVKDVYMFDKFYEPFSKILKQIRIENPNRKIIINLSSGTPAMKSTMLMLSILENEDIVDVQVKSPQKGSNAHTSHDYAVLNENVEEKMSQLMETEFNENRCSTKNNINTRKVILIDKVKAMLKANDFIGVLRLLKSNKDILNERIIQIANHIYYRYIGEFPRAENYAKELGLEKELYPIKQVNVVNFFEKTNILKIKFSRNEIQDGLLIASTIIESLYEAIIKNKVGNIKKYDNNFNEFVKEFPEYTKNIILTGTDNFTSKYKEIVAEKIISKEQNKEYLEKFEVFHSMRAARNKLAHTLDYMDVNTIQNFNKEELVKAIEFFICKLFKGSDENKKEYLKIYSIIKNMLIEELNNIML